MCGRYVLLSELQEILLRYDVEESDVSNFNSGEIFPGNFAPVLVSSNSKSLKLFKWGLSFKGGKSLIINARGETITEKPMFKNSFYHRRCIIPINAFFEWKKAESKKIKHIINVNNQNISSLAGIYNISVEEKNNPVWSFAIITTSPNSKMSQIHDRMPVILRPEDEGLWLDSNTDSIKLKSLIVPFRDNDLQISPA